jgi:hypothetical protein
MSRHPIVPAFRNISLDEALVSAILKLIQLGTYPITGLLDLIWLLFTQATAVVNADETVRS